MRQKLLTTSLNKNGLIAGAVTALALSIYVSFHFRAGLLEPFWLAVWYLVSIFLGGISGVVGNYLAGLLHLNLNSVARIVVGASFGLGAFIIQLYLFIILMFRISNTPF